MSAVTKWKNNTYVLLSDLHDDHEIALIENSLRDSEFYSFAEYFDASRCDNCIGVLAGDAGLWTKEAPFRLIPITRTQALKLAGVEL